MLTDVGLETPYQGRDLSRGVATRVSYDVEQEPKCPVLDLENPEVVVLAAEYREYVFKV